MTRLYTQGELPHLLLLECEQFELDRSLVDKSIEIHKKIQGMELPITKGLKPQFIDYLSTSFHRNKASRDVYINHILQQAKDQGFELPELT